MGSILSGSGKHTGLKLPYFTFMSKDAGIEAKEPPLNMLIGMGMAAFMCTFIGIFPEYLYKMLPYAINYQPYSIEHLVWTGQILLFTWFGFYFYIKKLGGEPTISLDTDWLYRKGAILFMKLAKDGIAVIDNKLSQSYKTIFIRVTKLIFNTSYYFDKKVIDGMVNGVAGSVLKISDKLRTIQTGQLQHYGAAIIIGLLILINILFFFQKFFK